MKLRSELPLRHKIERLLFHIFWTLFVYPLPRNFGAGYKRFILRLFGATISKDSQIYSSAKIYYPRNLIMEGFCSIGPNAIIYNVDKIIIKDRAAVSQGAHLCTASHDISSLDKDLIHAPILLEEYSWVCADAFVGMGVTVHEGAVVGARAVVCKDVAPWTVVVGNPAKEIKKRILNQQIL